MSNLIFNLSVNFEKRYSKKGKFLEKKMVAGFDTPPCTVERKILPNKPVTGNVTIEYTITPVNVFQFFSHHKEEFDYDIDFVNGISQTTTVVIITKNKDGISYSESACFSNDEEEEVIKPVGN